MSILPRYFSLEEKKSLKNGELSWIEQKQFVQLTIDALGNHSLVRRIKNNWKEMDAIVPELESKYLNKYYKKILLYRFFLFCRLQANSLD